jgi:hypothetical protein
MVNEMIMKNVWKIELRSPNKLSYDNIKKYLLSHDIPLTPVRGKFDTYWITPELQVEFGVDCMFIGANGDFKAFNGAGYIFESYVVHDFPFSNLRQVKSNIEKDVYFENGVEDKIAYAKDHRKK